MRIDSKSVISETIFLKISATYMLIANHLKTKPFKKKLGRLDAISLQNAYLLNIDKIDITGLSRRSLCSSALRSLNSMEQSISSTTKTERFAVDISNIRSSALLLTDAKSKS